MINMAGCPDDVRHADLFPSETSSFWQKGHGKEIPFRRYAFLFVRTQQMNTQKVVGKVGKFNICFRQEQLSSHARTVLLHDFAQWLGVTRLLDEELKVKVWQRGYSEGQAIGELVYN